ncbi:uncharacterized protein LOC115970583 [Quercus lobata]|uniref:uncharacterized protein LOC115970583 n=1 Tax=Quercus lobata TaxID=97700 RepID=UPI001243A0EE|nr:uncharacterized protein LOC115970583 [Quercus lobata]
MREGETLKTYSDRYWEMFNEIDGDFDDVAINTFKVGLPTEHSLRKSLINKPITNVRQLMNWIDKYKRIRGYDVKKVMVGQGSGAEIMYLDLYKGLNLRPKDLTAYDSPLVSFDGKDFIPRGQIRLPMQVGSEVVEVDFIVVDAYSPYTAIMARPWLYALRAVSSTLHQKVKYLANGQINEIVGSQSTARQCLVAAILHQLEAESSASAERGL